MIEGTPFSLLDHLDHLDDLDNLATLCPSGIYGFVGVVIHSMRTS